VVESDIIQQKNLETCELGEPKNETKPEVCCSALDSNNNIFEIRLNLPLIVEEGRSKTERNSWLTLFQPLLSGSIDEDDEEEVNRASNCERDFVVEVVFGLNRMFWMSVRLSVNGTDEGKKSFFVARGLLWFV